MTGAKHKVSIVKVREQQTYAALRDAADLIGGISDVVGSGNRVLVKPNYTFGPTGLGITNPVVVEAVLRLVSQMSPRSITIGEGSGASYTAGAFRVYDIYDMASRYGASVVDLNMDEGVRQPVPQETGREYVVLPRTVAESDVLISVPTFKLWFETPLSLSLKNLFGLYPGRYYGYNKDSRESEAEIPDYYLPGEIGAELGIHRPTILQSIAAINIARPSDLTVIDALEGSDGQGNFIRLDTLFMGRNALATDCVAMAAGGFHPETNDEVAQQVSYYSQMGLGPHTLGEIEVCGQSIEDVSFPLARLRENVLELPIPFCLERLSTGELRIIAENLERAGLLGNGVVASKTREALMAGLVKVMTQGDYVQRAADVLPRHGKALLPLLLSMGGTSGDFFQIQKEYTKQGRDADHFWAGFRALTRLGLAFLFHGQFKCYVVLAEGVGRVQ